MLLKVSFDVVYGITGKGDLVASGIHVHHEACWRDANQYQHNQTIAFLTIVRAVLKRHADSGKDQRDTRPERRLLLAVCPFTLRGGQVDTGAVLGAAPVATQQENQTASKHQADNRGNDQRTENT